MTVSHTWTSMYIKCPTMFYHLFWIIITVITKHMLRTWVKWEKLRSVFWTYFQKTLIKMAHGNFGEKKWWQIWNLINYLKFLKKIRSNVNNKKWSIGLNRCWWRMLETKCVGDTFEMLAAVLAVFVTNILYHLTWASGINNQKISPVSKLYH